MIVDIEEDGKKYKVVVPDKSDPDTWQYGLRIGPPDFRWLPPHIDTRLHNELYNRGLITVKDVVSNSDSVRGALQAALRIDIQTVIQTYVEESTNA